MNNDSAPGPDRVGVSWLLLVAKNEFRIDPDLSELQLLSLIIHKITAGGVSAHVSLVLSAVTLIPLDKGAAKLRPIAIGIILRRLETRVLITTVIAEAKYYFFPLQVGCSVRCGVDTVVHETRAFIDERRDDPTFLLNSADAENAFKNSSHEKMLRQTAEHAPFLIRMAAALYAKGSPYFRLGDELIRSRERTQHGNLTSSLLFALPIHPIFRRIDTELDLLVHRWYADDNLISDKIYITSENP